MVNLMQLKNKQYILTIPKNIVEAMRLKKGDAIAFIFDRGEVIMRKKE